MRARKAQQATERRGIVSLLSDNPDLDWSQRMFANTVEIDIRDDSPDVRDLERVRQALHRSRILPQNFGGGTNSSSPAQLVRNATHMRRRATSTSSASTVDDGRCSGWRHGLCDLSRHDKQVVVCRRRGSRAGADNRERPARAGRYGRGSRQSAAAVAVCARGIRAVRRRNQPVSGVRRSIASIAEIDSRGTAGDGTSAIFSSRARHSPRGC